MIGLGPLGFAAPLALAALAALPVLWWLLRVTPPSPRRIDFPPLKILMDLQPRDETPARTPWWLVALRMAIAALAILAVSGPVWNPSRIAAGGSGPIVVVIDTGFAAAPDWEARRDFALRQIEEAGRFGRRVALIDTADPAVPAVADEAGRALERVRAMRPQAFAPDRAALVGPLGAILRAEPQASVLWIADGVTVEAQGAAHDEIARLLAGREVTLAHSSPAPTLAIAGVENRTEGLTARVVRTAPNGRDEGIVRAYDRRGLLLGETSFSFPERETLARALVALPLDLRNDIARLEIQGERSAGAVALLDARSQRRRVGVVSGATADTAQPLLSPAYYVTRALAPYADIREPRLGPSEAVNRLLDEQASVLVLTDVGGLDERARTRIERFVDDGGVLIRFAGSRLAAAGDDGLSPVRLRRGGRDIGGALSWDQPKAMSPFGADSPFAGLTPPAEVQISRQLLAEPDAELSRRTWAALVDGTPIVTGERRGKGVIVLFHITSDTGWSSLPLSGLFVDMLRRLVDLARMEGGPASAAEATVTVAPTRILDGFGRLGAPPATAKPVSAGFSGRASRDHPAGLYGGGDTPLAVNVLTAGDALVPFALPGLAVTSVALSGSDAVDLRAVLIALALLLLVIDTIASLWLAGRLWLPRRTAARAAGLVLAAGLLAGAASLTPARAQAAPPAPEAAAPVREVLEAALTTRLAYVITGDATVDETSRAGLRGLSRALATRTAFEPGEPVGVDLARDELVFFPVLYWPIVAGRPTPPDAAIRRLATFMKNGGMVIFDTRDALSQRPGGAPTPENLLLRRILASIDVPVLEQLPRDHVVTKAFYLIERLTGRYDSESTWVEALPPADPEGRRPARSGDSVSPIVITANDLAGAWAIGAGGEPLYPLVPGHPRQREFALRAGVNLLMYAMTGNYKADQVHVPALLERLGQ